MYGSKCIETKIDYERVAHDILLHFWPSIHVADVSMSYLSQRGNFNKYVLALYGSQSLYCLGNYGDVI